MATDPTKHLLGYGRRDAATGMLHGHIRWPHGTTPNPYGCRWCGDDQNSHGRQWTAGHGMHSWQKPTEAQIKARMLARRNARKAVCRCPQDDDMPRPFAPVVDPYSCEAADCHGSFSELSPFGGGPVHGHDAKVSRTCGQCGYRTSVWHVNDGSAEEELHRHITRVHNSHPVDQTAA
ncbi:hypothetical protein PV382_23815 [Streptomyces scabiei]|uniref:hypothetical protein n=1 Tax=Streptomyces scabiei TaxID=1930 RepID=UPI0007C6F445|nr:hypothetical protein [Streptomyces scabiei]MDX2999691.1 hypothetical protein [Streptomyces scabiei]MDX3053112.1 hypothetical protein [Streptomyces scabiei]MDX3175280.1 hypothetical protein [Streptomyces scabiei]